MTYILDCRFVLAPLFGFQGTILKAVGVFNGEGPPVPIPNTEVKLTSADNTCLETDWEDRSMPTYKSAEAIASAFLLFMLHFLCFIFCLCRLLCLLNMICAEAVP